MANTNQYGQTTDAKGHVLPTREIVAAELTTLLGTEIGPRDPAVAFVMEQKNDDYYRGYRLGIEQGRREAQAIIAAAKEAQ